MQKVIRPGFGQVYRDAQGDGYPLWVSVGKLGGMTQVTDFLLDQIRTIANLRLMCSKPLTELSRTHMKRVDEALKLLNGE
jgi:mRNA interferase MazF